MRLIGITSLLLLQFAIAFAQDYAALHSQLDSLIREKNIPGAQVCIVDPDSTLWEASFGYSDISDSTRVSSESMFRIGSTSKSFTGIAIMQLLEQGRLKLEDPISKHIPNIKWTNRWEDTDPVRIIHLLEHTTGFDDMHLKEYSANAEGWTLKQGLDYAPNSRTSRWKPGLHSSYCNSGPPMAAYIVETITGRTIEEYVDEQIFQALGMKHSTFLRTSHVDSFLVKGYSFKPPKEQAYWHIIQRPAGAINSTALEMASYVRMFLNQGIYDSMQILTPGSIQRIEQPESTLAAKSGSPEGYAKYLYTRNFYGIKWIGHDGGMMGFLCAMHYSRDLTRGFIILINDNGDIHALEKLVIDFLSKSSLRDTTLTPAQVSSIDPQFLGAYTSATSRNQISRFIERVGSLLHISAERDTLWYTEGLFGSRQQIYEEGDLLFISSKSGEREPLTFASYDSIRYLQGTGNYRQTKAWKIWGEICFIILFSMIIFIGLLIGLIALLLRAIKRRIPHDRYLLWPGIIGLWVLTFLLGFQIGSIDPFKSLSSPTVWSLLILVSPVAICIASFLCMISAFRWRKDSAPTWLKMVLCVFAILSMVISVYLFRHGVVGIRTWAY